MLPEVLCELERNLKLLNESTAANDESLSNSVNQLLQQLQTCNKDEHALDESLLQRYKDCVWSKKESSVLRTALNLLEKKATVDVGAVLLQGLLIASESPEFMGVDEFRNFIVFVTACVEFTRHVRASRLAPITKMLRNLLLSSQFRMHQLEIESKLVLLRNSVLRTLSHLISETSGIGSIIEILSILVVNLCYVFDDEAAHASVSLIIRRVQTFDEKFKKPPVIEVAQIFSVLHDLLKHTNTELRTEERSTVWILWKRYFTREAMSVRSVVVVNAIQFMRAHFNVFTDFIANDCQIFYNLLLDFAFSSEANKQNKIIEKTSLDLAIDFVATLPHLFSRLGIDQPDKRQELVKYFSKVSYQLTLKDYRKMCFGVISLAFLPPEAFNDLAQSGARFSTVRDAVMAFLETYRCSSLCREYCIRARLLSALVEAADSAKDSSFFDLSSTGQLYDNIEECWFGGLFLCDKGITTNAQLFSRLFSITSERSRCVKRFLNHFIENAQSNHGIAIWKQTCAEIPLSDVLSQFVSNSMAILAKELISSLGAFREAAVSLFAGFCSCGSISVYLDQCFFSVIMYFLDDFIRTQSLVNLSIMASIVRQESYLSFVSGAGDENRDALFNDRIIRVIDLLTNILLNASCVDTVVEYFPCFALLSPDALDDETRVRDIASLVERVFEKTYDDGVIQIAAKLCDRSVRLRKSLCLVLLRNYGIEQVQWNLLKVVASEDTLTWEDSFSSGSLGPTSLMITVGHLEIEAGTLLKEISKCFPSQEMDDLFVGLAITTIGKVLIMNDSAHDGLLRFCCTQLAISPATFIVVFEKYCEHERFQIASIRTLLSLASTNEAKRFETMDLLKKLVSHKQGLIEVLAQEVTEEIEPRLAGDLLGIFENTEERFASVVQNLLKSMGKTTIDPRLLKEVDFSKLYGIELIAKDLLNSDSVTLDQMAFAVKLLPDRDAVDWVYLARRSLSSKCFKKTVFLLEQAQDTALISSDLNLISILEGQSDNPGWITVVYKLSKLNSNGFENLIQKTSHRQIADSVFKSAHPLHAAEVMEMFWKIIDEDSKAETRKYVREHYDPARFILQPSNLINIDEAVATVQIHERLVLSGLWDAPFQLSATVDKVLECDDIYGQLLTGRLWNQMLASSLLWEESMKCIAENAYRLFVAERQDLLPYFLQRLEKSAANAAEFIACVPSKVEVVLTKVLEGHDRAPILNSVILNFCRNQTYGNLFTAETFRLLQVAKTTPWGVSDLANALERVSSLLSKKLKRAFLELIPIMIIDERLCSKLVTDWIPLEGAEPDEVLDAILETENGFLWKHLLLNVFFVDGNPAAARVSQWLDKHTGSLKNAQNLLESVMSLCIAGDDVLPRLPSKSEMRQFKIVENVLSKILDAAPSSVFIAFVEKAMESGGAIESMMTKAEPGMREIAFLLLFIRLFEKTDSEMLEDFCHRKENVGPSRQPLKTFLVVRCLQQLKKCSNDDGRDPYMKWTLHVRAFNLCSAVLLRSKRGKTRHTYLNNIFSSPAMWDRLAGHSSVIGISFGNTFTCESGIRKRKTSASDEVTDDHDFTSAESIQPDEEEPALNTSTRVFSIQSHPSLHSLISLTNHCLEVVDDEHEDVPLWLKNLKVHLESNSQNVNTMIFVLAFVHSCGKHFEKHRREFDSVLSSCMASVLRDAAVDCSLIIESLEMCSQIDSNLAQIIFNRIFSSGTTSSRNVFIKNFSKFYNPITHQINLSCLEDALSPAITWCRYEVCAVFYRNNQSFGVLDIGRVDWKNTVDALGDFSGGMSGSYLRKSIAKMISSALGMANRMGYCDAAMNLQRLTINQLRKCQLSEKYRLMDILSEDYPAIVDEFVDEILDGVGSQSCRFHAFRLLRTVVVRHSLGSEKLIALFSLDLNAPTRLLLLETIREICRGCSYDSSTKQRILETYLERFTERHPTLDHLRALIDIHSTFPRTIARHLAQLWTSLPSDLKEFLVDEWIEKNDTIECETSLDPELSVRLLVRMKDLLELFGEFRNPTKLSASFSQFLCDEPQVAIELLKSDKAAMDTIKQNCTQISTCSFYPRLAWKLMNIMKPSEGAYQEIMEIYGIPKQCWPLNVSLDNDAARIAGNCFSPEDAIIYLRLCTNLSPSITDYLGQIFVGNFNMCDYGKEDVPNLLKSLAAKAVLLFSENWTALNENSLERNAELSQVEVHLYCRAQLENERKDDIFWRNISSIPLFEAQLYLLEFRIQNLENGNDIEILLNKLKNGLQRVWIEVNEEQRARLIKHVQAISDLENMLRSVSNENADATIHRLCLNWLHLPNDRLTVLRRIRLMKGMSKHGKISTKTFAFLATAIAKHYIQLLNLDILLIDPRTRESVSFTTKSRQIQILTEVRKLLPGCEPNKRAEMISDVEEHAIKLL